MGTPALAPQLHLGGTMLAYLFSVCFRLFRWKAIHTNIKDWNGIRCFACVRRVTCLLSTQNVIYSLHECSHCAELHTYGRGMCHFCLFTPIRTKLILFIWKLYFIISSLLSSKYHNNNNNDEKKERERELFVYVTNAITLLKFTWCLLVDVVSFLFIFRCHFFVFRFFR